MISVVMVYTGLYSVLYNSFQSLILVKYMKIITHE